MKDKTTNTKQTIYKLGSQYLMDRSKLLSIVYNEIQRFFLVDMDSDLKENGNFPIESNNYTDVANEFNIGSVTLPIDHLLVIDEKKKSLNTGQLLIRLSVDIRESIEGEEYEV